MNRVQRKISKEVNKRIDKAIDNYFSCVDSIKLENGSTLIQADPYALEKLVTDTTRHRIKRQVIKEFKEQGIL